MDGSRKNEAASPKHHEAAPEELFSAIKKLRSDGIHNPELHLPEPLLKVLKLEPDSPFLRHQVFKARRGWRRTPGARSCSQPASPRTSPVPPGSG